MGPQDLLALGCSKVRGDDLKRLVAIEAGVQLRGRIRYIETGLSKRFLKAAQVLRHAVNKSALDIEDIAREHIDLAVVRDYTAEGNKLNWDGPQRYAPATNRSRP